jgi:membrane protease YdiL (CAAX protease family)
VILSRRGAAAVAVLVEVLGLAAALFAGAALSAAGLVGSSWRVPREVLRQTLIAAVYLVPLLFVLRLTRSGPESVGLTRTNLGRSLAIGGVLAVAWLLVSGTLDELLKPRAEHVLVLIGALSVGFAEEIVARGYVQSRLIDWIGTRRGILLATLIFALLHVPQLLQAGVGAVDVIRQLVVVTVLGGAFGVLQASARNVTLPGIVHTAIDWSARFVDG